MLELEVLRRAFFYDVRWLGRNVMICCFCVGGSCVASVIGAPMLETHRVTRGEGEGIRRAFG